MSSRAIRASRPVLSERRIAAFLVSVLLALAAWLVAPPSAGAKGGVEAPRDLGPRHCKPGADVGRTPFTPRPFVLGCAALRETLLLAADHGAEGRRGWACLYTAPAGGFDADGPCFPMRPDAPFGPPAPVQGGKGIRPLSVGRLGGGAFLVVQASSEVRDVVLRYRVPGPGPADSIPAASRAQAVIGIGQALARRIGAPRAFRLFVGEVPREAITCMGVRAFGYDKRGRRVQTMAIERGHAERGAGEAVELPGSRDCDELAVQTALGSLATLLRRVLPLLSGGDGGRKDGRSDALLHLAEPAQLGVRCPRPHHIGCDGVSLAVSLEQPAAELTARVGDRTVPMRPTAGATYWEGTLGDAGLQGGALDTCTGADEGECPEFWYGVPEVYAPIQLDGTLEGGRRASRSLVAPLRPGYR